MAKTVNARTLPVQSIGYKYGKLIIPPYEVDVEFTPLEEAALDSGITADMIPSTAGVNNKLADELYVNNAVSEYSAQFLGTSALNLTEEQFLAWANTLDADNNDYCYWWTVDSDSKTIYKRYKYNGTDWLFEYNVADPSSVPTALSQLTDDANHRLVTDTEKSTWDNKADTTDIPSALSELSEDTTHRVVTDTEKGTWNGKADVGTSLDDKTANTIYGAKAFATDADEENAYFQLNFAAIVTLSESLNAGITINTTNPEWKLVITDKGDKILLGKKQDDSWYFAANLDTILDAILSSYHVKNFMPSAVDLGLPSGTLWCDHNIGAVTPYDIGLYFSWGNVEGHAEGSGYSFDSTNYNASTGSALTNDIPINNTYDACMHNNGNHWRLPNKDDVQELFDNCTQEWINVCGVNGIRFTSRINGNSIFIPVSGYAYGTSISNKTTHGYVWCSTLKETSKAYHLVLTSNGASFDNSARIMGFPVRAVL